MLSARNRMRRSEDFSDALRQGARGSAARVVVHLNENLTEGEPSVGFVVSKAVGNSVIRHRVQRQLRHLMRDRIDRFGAGTRVVVRALPPAAGSSAADLGADLDRALAAAARRSGTRRAEAGSR